MASILTFLGKGGTGRTTASIAAARQLAAQGKRVLLVGQDASPGFAVLVGASGLQDGRPQDLGANLKVVQLHTTVLLEQSWEELKRQEAQYLRTPLLQAVYGQELGILPGMDTALALNALREYDASGAYDAIVYDGHGDQATLRMLGMPEILSWYTQRFRQLFTDSDLGRALSPFLQPIAAAVLNVSWSGDLFSQPAANQMTSLLDQGKAAVADPHRVAAWLVTTTDPSALATAKYLWGSAQQAGVTIGGVLLNQVEQPDAISPEFAPLSVCALPRRSGDDWQTLMQALPDWAIASQAPRPIRVDVADRKIYLFLPGFDKKQVKLTQYGLGVTVEAGDQRRNVILPPELAGRSVAGAKFQDGYLIISL